MSRPTTMIHSMQHVQLKYLSAGLIVCFALNAFLRKYLVGINDIFDIILGSLPNFVAVFVISIVLTDQKRVVGIYKYMIILTMILLFIIEEYYPTFTGNKIFDLYDILASVLGGVLAIILTFYYSGMKLENNIKEST